MQFWTDPLILAAGNARGLEGGDPDALPNSPTAGAIEGRRGPSPRPMTRAIVSEDRAAELRAMSPEARARLAEFMRQSRDRIPGQIETLRRQYRDMTEWLAEFGPGGDPE